MTSKLTPLNEGIWIAAFGSDQSNQLLFSQFQPFDRYKVFWNLKL